MINISHLLIVADAYLAASDAKYLKTVSHRVFGDSKKLDALHADGDITVGRFNAAMKWFYENWPEGVGIPVELDPFRIPSPEKDVA